MSENINFIPANELPVAEGDEVSVLCLENGELRQKAASGLGGGGYDAVISVTIGDGGEPIPELTSGSYDVIREKVLTGDVPNIKVVGRDGSWRFIDHIGIIEVCEDMEEDDFVFIQLVGRGVYFGIRPDNSMFVD